MREFVKSMLSYSWAMSVFGGQQVANLLTPGEGDPGGKVAAALNNVTEATTATFEAPFKTAFEAGDRLQTGVIDVMFGGLTSAGLDPGSWVKTGVEGMQKMAGMAASAARNATTPAPGPAASQQGPAPSSASPQSAGWGPAQGH